VNGFIIFYTCPMFICCIKIIVFFIIFDFLFFYFVIMFTAPMDAGVPADFDV